MVARTAIRYLANAVPPKPSALLNSSPIHLCYVLLKSPIPISAMESRHSTAIQRALQLEVTRWGAVVNWAWYPDEPPSSTSADISVKAFFTSGEQLDIPVLSEANVKEVADSLRAAKDAALEAAPLSTSLKNRDVYLYVCTHGSRDCRCGTTGVDVATALRDQVQRRGVEAQRLKVAEVAHVGGHKYVVVFVLTGC